MSSLPHLRPPPEAVAAPVHCEAVDSLAALERLAPAWERLWRRAAASAFQAPAWLLPWWKHVGKGALACVAVREAQEGTLVGFAPLYISTDPATGRRHLFPLGIATTDRLDGLVAPGWHARVLPALADTLHAWRDRFDVLEVPQLPAGAALLGLPWPRGWRHALAPGEPNPVLPLPAALPPGMARNLAYCRRRAAREGEVAVVQADAGSLHGLLDTLERLHGRRWAARGEAGVLRDAGVGAWHREAAPQLLAAGLLRLLALRIGGETLAVLYGLADPPGVPRRRWSYYIGGFEPGAAALSPGTLLVGEAIAQAQAEGAAVFDFLRGDEPYKARWGAVPETLHVLRAWPE